MQQKMEQLESTLQSSMFKIYIKQKEEELESLSSTIPIFEIKTYLKEQRHNLYLQNILSSFKDNNILIEDVQLGCKEYLFGLKMSYLYQFFSKFHCVMRKQNTFLAECLLYMHNDKINETFHRKKDVKNIHIIQGTLEQQNSDKINQIYKQKGEKQLTSKQKQSRTSLERINKIICQILYDEEEEEKRYQRQNMECNKLLLQKHLIQKIEASTVSKQIIEITQSINQIMQKTDKLFHDTYMLKFMEFKEEINQLHKPEEFKSFFIHGLNDRIKEEFQVGIKNVIRKIVKMQKLHKQERQTQSSVQTQNDSDYKVHKNNINKNSERLQNLLINERKLNEKNTLQILQLKKKLNYKNQPSIIEEIQGKIRQETKKQSQIKYNILQKLYNQKCFELSKMLSEIQAKNIENQKRANNERKIINSSSQTQVSNQQKANQTDKDFYYYFENESIQKLQTRINELQKIIHHKEYEISQMEAIKTFRDKFKSKKEIFAVSLKSVDPNQNIKSLSYLKNQLEVDENDYQDDFIKMEGKLYQFSKENSKKQVKFNNLNRSNSRIGCASSKMILKKKTKLNLAESTRSFAKLNDKIEEATDQEISLVKIQLQEAKQRQFSLKNVLKNGCQKFKEDKSVQTQEIKYINEKDISKNQTLRNTQIRKDKKQSRFLTVGLAKNPNMLKNVPGDISRTNTKKLTKNSFIGTKKSSQQNRNILREQQSNLNSKRVSGEEIRVFDKLDVLNLTKNSPLRLSMRKSILKSHIMLINPFENQNFPNEEIMIKKDNKQKDKNVLDERKYLIKKSKRENLLTEYSPTNRSPNHNKLNQTTINNDSTNFDYTSMSLFKNCQSESRRIRQLKFKSTNSKMPNLYKMFENKDIKRF